MEEKKRAFYSVPAKTVVLCLCALGIFLAGFCGILLLDLASRGVPIGRAKTPYESTESCGVLMTGQLEEIQDFYEGLHKLHISDAPASETTVDITEFGEGVLGEAGENTSYTLEQLDQMTDGILSMFNDYMMYSAQEYATNDAGVEVYEDTYDENGEYVDVYQKAREDQKTYLNADYNIIVDPDGNEIDCNGSHFTPSQQTISSLEAQECDYKDYSSQFLYLYELGGDYETELPQSGVSLRDYAAKNRQVSLYDLYQALYNTVRTLQNYRNADGDMREESNVQYCIELEDGTVYTNVDSWSGGYDTAVSAMSASEEHTDGQLVGVAYSRELGRAEFKKKSPSSDMMQVLTSWISANNLVTEGEKAVVVLNTSWPVEDEFSQAASVFSVWGSWTPLLAGLTAAGIVLGLVGLVLVTLQAGRNCYNREIRLYSFDGIPTEVYLILIFLTGALIICLPVLVIGVSFDQYPTVYTGNSQSYFRDMQAYRSLFAGLSLSGGIMLMMPIYSSLIRRIKGKNLWSRSLVRSIFQMCREVYDARKMTQKILMVFAIFALLQVIFIGVFGGFGIFLAVLLDIIAALYLVREAAGRQTIQQGLRRIGSGDLEYKIDLTTLRGDNLEMAETVNSVGKGLQAAIQEQMKSERLKADLITNVSHDIKTPLTSIINYVDLLKREGIQDPKIKGYIDILDAKSQRLKQLTEDLVEASKISSGNIKLEFMNLNLNELIQQVNGEFDERFKERNLSLICVLGNEPLVIRADSRRIWRVLENLYVNVVKYAMPGTRVYVDAVKRNDKVVFSIKNISENPLNIDADELTERFIRGDVSRSTEGSGLGLSIAKNLTNLQHGTFRIYLDGDLFKVTITFDEVKEQKKQPKEPAPEPSGQSEEDFWEKLQKERKSQ